MVGTTVVLSDGTVAKSGGKVIKNVAGYDLAKLFAGSFGTLGLIAIDLRAAAPAAASRPPPSRERFDDPDALLREVLELARRPLEADCFDVVWEDGSGRILRAVLGRVRGRAGRARIGDAVDGRLGRRCARCSARPDGAVLKVSGRPTDLPDVIRAAGDAHRRLARRARAVLARVRAGEDLAERVAAARQALAPRACTVLDGAARVDDQWPDAGPARS